MATTYFKAVHRSNSGSISSALKTTINYAENPNKTNGGVLVLGYECAPQLAASEFLLSKSRYEQITGRNQGKNDIIGYQIRQSFKPGEVTPEEALKIGYETAMRFTKGRHQFIVAVHTNTSCVHSHTFFNSVNLDCNRKFKDFRFSAIALRRMSDMLCLENGLSIVENPGLSKGRDYAKYMGDRKPPTMRDKLCMLIDNSLSVGMTFEDFIAAMRTAGCEVKRGKQLAFRLPDAKKFARLDTLGDDYSEAAIMERLAGTRIDKPRVNHDMKSEQKIADNPLISVIQHTQNRPSMLIDIQAKIREGAGGGYQQWMKIFNLKTAAKTLMFLQEIGVDSYDELIEKSGTVSAEYHAKLMRIKAIETRQKDISELQKQIGTYTKTRDTYTKYKASGYNKDFYEANRTAITMNKAARDYFDEQGFKGKLPSITSLKQEYAKLDVEKKSLYVGYYDLKENYKALLVARGNSERILGKTRTSSTLSASTGMYEQGSITHKEQILETGHEQERSKKLER